MFVTILRTAGVPATLGIVTNKTGDGGPIVRPYPNWEMNQNKDCKGLLNVYRIAVSHLSNLKIKNTIKLDITFLFCICCRLIDVINCGYWIQER